jgi:hypothetical protein
MFKWEKIRPWNTTRRGFSRNCNVPPKVCFFFIDIIYSCFYLDTPYNARKNGMTASSKHEDAIVKRFINYTFLNNAY